MKLSVLLAEVIDKGRSSQEQDNAVLLADAACSVANALHRQQQHDHAENATKYGG